MTDSPNPEKKIIVDEDWKEHAQQEKEELAKKQKEAEAAKDAAKTAGAGKTAGEGESQAAGAGEMQWPEPSLLLLVTTLATQAMVALGLVPHPTSGESEPDLGQAKHFIGTIELLLEKTEGNRSEEESEMIEEVLHQLRMGFVSVNKA